MSSASASSSSASSSSSSTSTPSTGATAPAPPADNAARKAELLAFYKHHDTTKSPLDVDAIFDTYTFKEIVKSLQIKYKAVPAGWESELPSSFTQLRRVQLVDFYNKHDPDKVGDVDMLLTSYLLVETVKSLQIKYGEVPPGWESELPPSFTRGRRQELVDFYRTYEPSKLPEVDWLLINYPLKDTVKSLWAKYGRIPVGWETELFGPRPSRAEQLAFFYARYDPSKLSDVDKLLANYDFTEIVKSIQMKFGAVPPGWEQELVSLMRDGVGGKPKTIVIDAGDKYELKLACKPGQVVKWCYGLNMDEDCDVGFEVSFVGTDYGNFNQVANVVPWSRVRAPRWPEGVDGSFEAGAVGNVVITFDNSYSWLKAKAIIFKTEASSAQGEDTEVPV